QTVPSCRLGHGNRRAGSSYVGHRSLGTSPKGTPCICIEAIARARLNVGFPAGRATPINLAEEHRLSKNHTADLIVQEALRSCPAVMFDSLSHLVKTARTALIAECLPSEANRKAR